MPSYVQFGSRAVPPGFWKRAPLLRRRERKPGLDVILAVIGVALVSGLAFGEFGARAGSGAPADQASPLQHLPR